MAVGGNNGNQAVGDNGNQAVGNNGNQAVGDNGNQAVGDNGNQAVGDNRNQAVGGNGNQAVGDNSGNQAVGYVIMAIKQGVVIRVLFFFWNRFELASLMILSLRLCLKRQRGSVSSRISSRT